MRRRRGFTLAECMIAIVFISIALFGYIGLHMRLIHSGLKVESRLFHTEIARFRLGAALSELMPKPSCMLSPVPAGAPNPVVGVVPGAQPSGTGFALLPYTPVDGMPAFTPYYTTGAFIPFRQYYEAGYPEFRACNQAKPVDQVDWQATAGIQSAGARVIPTGEAGPQMVSVEETWNDRNGSQRLFVDTGVGSLHAGW